MIRSIIFDLDGTLIDSSMVCAKILSDKLRDRGSMRTITAELAIRFHSMGGATFQHGHAEVGSDRALLIQFDQFADLVAHIRIARRTFRARRCAA